MYNVKLTKDAAKFYKKSDAKTKKALNKCFKTLELDPKMGSNIKKLQGELSDLHRYRTGNLRIIYKVEAELISVIVVAIGSRGDIYK